MSVSRLDPENHPRITPESAEYNSYVVTPDPFIVTISDVSVVLAEYYRGNGILDIVFSVKALRRLLGNRGYNLNFKDAKAIIDSHIAGGAGND